MVAMTLDQQRAIAMASARARAAAAAPTAPAIPAAPAAPAAPRDYALGEVPGAALSNLPDSAGRFAGAIGHALANPIDTAAGAMKASYGAIAKFSPQALLFRKIFGTPEAMRDAIQAADAVGGVYRDRYGSYEAIKRTVAEDPVGAAADLSMIVGGAGAAAGKAGMVRTASGLNRGAAALNPLTVPTQIAGGLGKGAQKLGRVAVNALDPKTLFYLQATEGRGRDIVNALRNPNQVIVPGAQPTAAQAASGVGSTMFSAVGDEAARVLPTPFSQRAAQQNAAVMEHIQPTGQPGATVEAAQAIRSNVAGPHYARANQGVVEIDPVLDELLSRPAMRVATQNTSRSVANRGDVIGDPAQPAVPATYNPFNESAVPGTPAAPATLTGEAAHRLKMTLDEMLKKPENFGVEAMNQADLRALRNEYVAAIEQRLPGYAEGRALWAKNSPRVNQEEVLRKIADKIEPSLGMGTGDMRATALANALSNERTLLRQSLSTGTMQTLEKTLTPQQLTKLDNIAREFARQRATDVLAREGATAAPSLRRTGTQAAEGVSAPHLLSTATTLFNDIMNRLKGVVNEKLAMRIAEEMLDPSKAAGAIENALAREARVQAVAAPLAAAGKTATGFARAGGGAPVPALQEAERRNNLAP